MSVHAQFFPVSQFPSASEQCRPLGTALSEHGTELEERGLREQSHDVFQHFEGTSATGFPVGTNFWLRAV